MLDRTAIGLRTSSLFFPFFFFFNDTATTEIYTLSLQTLFRSSMHPTVTAWSLFSFFWALFGLIDRKSTRLNSSHQISSYAVFCLKKKNILFIHFGYVLIVMCNMKRGEDDSNT